MLTTILVALISALLGGGLAGAIVRSHYEKKLAQDARTASVTDPALELLGELDRTYRGVLSGSEDEDALIAAEIAARTAVDKCGDEPTAQAFDAFATTGRAFASDDLDTNEEQYSTDLDGVRGLLRRAAKNLAVSGSDADAGSRFFSNATIHTASRRAAADIRLEIVGRCH